MTYREIYEKAAVLIGKENISDYRPATIEEEFHVDDKSLVNVNRKIRRITVPNTINIWLKNGDVIWYCVRLN